MSKFRVYVSKGSQYGRWTVIKEDGERTKTSGDRVRLILCSCSCGNIGHPRLSDLIHGKSKSCGCLKVEKATKHGLRDHPIYSNWAAMINRSKTRVGCGVYEEWNDVSKFIEWAESSGYEDGLCLCRNGDTGNYEPGNVRWDTPSNNTKEMLEIRYSKLR